MNTLLFDLGAVLIDWNPRYLYRPLFKGDEKAIDTAAQTVITAQMNTPTPAPVVAEPVALVVTPPVVPPAPDVTAISAQAAADAITAERARITEIKAWAKSVEAVQKVSLTDAVDTFTANGKSLAELLVGKHPH